MLVASNITVTRGERVLFQNSHVSFAKARCTIVKGENGIGKSTLLKILSGTLEIDEGEVLWDNCSVIHNQHYFALLGYVPNPIALPSTLTVADYFLMRRCLDGMPEADWHQHAMQSLGIEALNKTRIGMLSSGQKQKIALSILWDAMRKVFLLDEPFSNLDHTGREIVRKKIAAQVSQGATVVMVSHEPSLDSITFDVIELS
ncbi:MAG: ATP-binding cassette domain-containing protein [Methylacidiphilales bacterium]|nr:ATP-binding cassette domain-containing protein [Candidatus Methylacidiphilales bacterium]